MIKLTTQEFIERAREIHGDKYDYSLAVYEHSLKEVKLICPQHGLIYIRPSNHINNKQGCYDCGKNRTHASNRVKLDQFLMRCKYKFGDKFDYSKVQLSDNLRAEIEIKCPVHGWFETEARDFLRSENGCNKCAKDLEKHTLKEFIAISNTKHNFYYSYDKTKYVSSHIPIIITCPKHGDIEVLPYVHITGNGMCPSCFGFVSKMENEIRDFLKPYVDDLQGSYRKLKNIKEIDIISLANKIGIEVDGLFWHSDSFKDKNYHANKTITMNNLGFRLIHIFEDEWLQKKEIVKSRLLNIFQCTPTKYYARKTEVKEVSYKESVKFLQNNHIQGNTISKIRLGLFINDELISLMTFGSRRKALGSKNTPNNWELLRYCNGINTFVVGGASKLFKYFLTTYKPKSIVSYCDLRWSDGNLYKQLGFTEIGKTKPNYFYVLQQKRHHRYNFTKHSLVEKGLDKNKTEKELMRELGYYRIYDCGNLKFTYNNEDEE